MALSDQTLADFFRDVYFPRRLVNSGRGTIQEVVINRFVGVRARRPAARAGFERLSRPSCVANWTTPSGLRIKPWASC